MKYCKLKKSDHNASTDCKIRLKQCDSSTIQKRGTQNKALKIGAFQNEKNSVQREAEPTHLHVLCSVPASSKPILTHFLPAA